MPSRSSSTKSRSTRTVATGKKPTETVKRFFYDDRLNSQNPRLTVVAYSHNLVTGETSYGASLFRQEKEREIENSFGKKKVMKKALLKTAQKRLEAKPVTIKTNAKNIKKLHVQIRKAMYKYGAFSKE